MGKTIVVSTRVTPKIDVAIKRATEALGYGSPSDFLAGAIREKLQKDTPHLLSED